jgi:hypothetical protein
VTYGAIVGSRITVVAFLADVHGGKIRIGNLPAVKRGCVAEVTFQFELIHVFLMGELKRVQGIGLAPKGCGKD